MHQALLIEGKITHRSEIIEIRELLKPSFNIGLGLSQFLILQLQLDLMDLQFLQEALRVGPCFDSPPFFRLPTQPRFSEPAQLAGGFGGVGGLFYLLVSPAAPGAVRIVSTFALRRGAFGSRPFRRSRARSSVRPCSAECVAISLCLARRPASTLLAAVISA